MILAAVRRIPGHRGSRLWWTLSSGLRPCNKEVGDWCAVARETLWDNWQREMREKSSEVTFNVLGLRINLQGSVQQFLPHS